MMGGQVFMTLFFEAASMFENIHDKIWKTKQKKQ